MSKIAKQLTELVGNTPLLELNKYSQAKGLETPVIAKVEFFNPGGSVKDRIALAMIEDAEAGQGHLEARCHHHRTYQWKYGRRTGTGISRQGLPPYPYHARDHECRAS